MPTPEAVSIAGVCGRVFQTWETARAQDRTQAFLWSVQETESRTVWAIVI